MKIFETKIYFQFISIYKCLIFKLFLSSRKLMLYVNVSFTFLEPKINCERSCVNGHLVSCLRHRLGQFYPISECLDLIKFQLPVMAQPGSPVVGSLLFMWEISVVPLTQVFKLAQLQLLWQSGEQANRLKVFFYVFFYFLSYK